MNHASPQGRAANAQKPRAAPGPTVHNTDTAPQIDHSNRSTTPRSDRFLDSIMSGWAETEEELPQLRSAARYAVTRRQKLAAQFIGKRFVIAAGPMRQRANDTFYQFRPHSAFAHLTGWGCDAEPGSLLVFDPVPSHTRSEASSLLRSEQAPANHDEPTHTATLYFRERASRDSEEFFANSEIGEFWIGPRPSLAQVSASLGIRTAPLHEFTASPGELRLGVESAGGGAHGSDDVTLARAASELRLVKDEYEIAQLSAAVAATARGFDEVLAALERATQEVRGERVIEGVFNLRARIDGNTVGYETIAAAGAHACTLHWVKNDGAVREGELLLLDAGVELDSLYTADITRTVPVSGTFSAVQRRVYEAVLEAADAARAIVRPGIRFGDVHDAAMRVIERYTRQWGLLPDTEADNVPYHRRYMVHGTSHHLGLDVHDCAQARRELYLDGTLEQGMVFTIEPGLYFQPDDLSVPEEYRGIGVRIEDDIVVTEHGCVNLSAAIPRTAAEVETWVRTQRGL